MKIILFVILCFVLTNIKAQNTVPPVIPTLHLHGPLNHRIDFGFRNKVVRVEEVHYFADEKGHEPQMIRVYLFSDFGELNLDFQKVLGENAAETAKEYIYTDYDLDSLKVSHSEEMFGSIHDFQTNERGHVTKETSVGEYDNYTQEYTYDDADNITKIEYKSKYVTEKTAEFVYDDYVLDYVKQTQVDLKKNKSVELTYYQDRFPLISAIDGEDRAMFHDTEYGSFTFTLECNKTMKEVEKLRELFRTDKKAYAEKVTSLYNAENIVRQYMDSRNEQGDWTKRYSVENVGGSTIAELKKNYIFRKLYYADGSTSGSTDFDTFFQMRVPRKN